MDREGWTIPMLSLGSIFDIRGGMGLRSYFSSHRSQLVCLSSAEINQPWRGPPEHFHLYISSLPNTHHGYIFVSRRGRNVD